MATKRKVNQYKSLIQTMRQRPSSFAGRGLIEEAESDRGRLMFSPAFRRLQQKAQVFSMEQNAAVRSRLTHSLEVAQTGRFIADKVCKQLLATSQIDDEQSQAIPIFVETACLMHDIGNPPFGHFGEAAIRQWFGEHGKSLLKKACGISDESLGTYVDNYLSDFLQFDGNPQGLRIVTKLQRNTDEFGLNLTYTSLSAYLKYLRCSSDKPEEQLFKKKCGFFITERDAIEAIWSANNYTNAQRFPLVYIMEAADDISYCISDLEDSIEKCIVSKSDAAESIYELFESNAKVNKAVPSYNEIIACLDKLRKKEETYINFRTSLIRNLVSFAAGNYLNNHFDIMSGQVQSLIPENSNYGIILSILKSYCKNNVYCHESVQKTEIAGYAAISGLLNIFKILLTCDSERFSSSLNYSENSDGNGVPIILEKKYLKIFPKNYIKNYQCEVEKINSDQKLNDKKRRVQEWNARAHLIVDYVSGMTDDFAMNTYRELCGISL